MRKEKLQELKKYIEELKVVAQIKEAKSSFITSIPYTFKLNNGAYIKREQILKNNNDGSAVIVIPLTIDNEILMVVEPRVFTAKTVSVSFPSGYLEEGESPYEAALRELKEETGYIPKYIKLLDSFYQDEGCSKAFNHIFIAFNCTCKSTQSLDEGEIIRYMTFNLKELDKLEQMGYLNSANSKLALAKGREYLRKKMR